MRTSATPDEGTFAFRLAEFEFKKFCFGSPFLRISPFARERRVRRLFLRQASRVTQTLSVTTAPPNCAVTALLLQLFQNHLIHLFLYPLV